MFSSKEKMKISMRSTYFSWGGVMLDVADAIIDADEQGLGMAERTSQVDCAPPEDTE
jgi:hypothetical protein